MLKSTPALGRSKQDVSDCERLLPGGRCGKNAVWHLIWAVGGGSSGSMTCDPCRVYAESRYDILQVHSFSSGCTDGLWYPDEQQCRKPHWDAHLGKTVL